MKNFLRVQKTSIFDGVKKITLRGVNLGGWLLMEGYILHAPNIAEQIYKKAFCQRLGTTALEEFECDFRDNFIQESDFKKIHALGLNCVRLPFNSRLIEHRSGKYSPLGVTYLDRAIQWARKYRLWVILDMHAACGAQNQDWHADSLGDANLWKDSSLQDRTVALWDFLAERYQNETAIAGYDLLNEPVIKDTRLLNRFYQRLVTAVRRHDKNHILFVEGNRWGMDLDCLNNFDDAQVVMSVHFYHPLEFTFNLVPQLSYPVRSRLGTFDRRAMGRMLEPYAQFGKKQQRPIFVGEFGVNARDGLYGESGWLKDILACFAQKDFHWTYWTWKAVKNSVFPDGVYGYHDNPAWVNRGGPRTGWETYADCWPHYRLEMAMSWRTEKFQENTEISRILREAAQSYA